MTLYNFRGGKKPMKRMFHIILSVMLLVCLSQYHVVYAASSIPVVVEPNDIYSETTIKRTMTGYTEKLHYKAVVEIQMKLKYNDANGKLVSVISYSGKIIDGHAGLVIKNLKCGKKDDHTIVVTFSVYYSNTDKWEAHKEFSV